MRFNRTNLAVAVSISLTACGGGGGGGGGLSATLSPASSTRDVPFYTPVRIDTIKPVDSNVYENTSSALMAQDLGQSAQSLILAGRMAPSGRQYEEFNLQIWDWENGSMVNRTASWFQNNDNQIVGTEPSVDFADFDNDGLLDMFVAPYTDTNVHGPGIVFFNEGGRFTRQEIDLDSNHAHGSTVADLDQDGFMDVVTTGMRFSFGGPNRTFTTHLGRGEYPGGGGDVAVADFLGDGTRTLIITDLAQSQADNNRLFSWRMEPDGVYVTKIADLPTPRFLLPKWQGYGFSGSHDVRVLAFDFDDSGLTDAVIFSRPASTNGQWPAFSEIQFNLNLGGGVFQDVTDTTLIGYDTTMPVPYNPSLADVNNDGLTDIILNGTGWDDNRGAQVLLHTQEHKYQASYAQVIEAFVDQAMSLEQAINATAGYGGNGIAFVRGPNDVMYLATAISYEDGQGEHRKAIYLSKLGNLEPSAQITANLVKQAWPWMSDGQVNEVLAASSTTWLNGVPVLDFSKSVSPIGELKINLDGRTGTGQAIAGHISVPGLNSSLFRGVVAVDDLKRNFQVDLDVLAPASLPMNVGYSQIAKPGQQWSARFVGADLDTARGFDARGDQRQWTTAFTVPWTGLTPDTTITAGVTQTTTNPWLNFSGVFGRVNASTTFDTTITHVRKDGYWGQIGMMQTVTDMTAGLVRKVDPLWSAYATGGWRQGSSNFYAGIQPTLFKGNIHLSLPTQVDDQGVLHYSQHRVSVRNQPLMFLGMDHSVSLKQGSVRLSAVANQTGAYHVGFKLQKTF